MFSDFEKGGVFKLLVGLCFFAVHIKDVSVLCLKGSVSHSHQGKKQEAIGPESSLGSSVFTTIGSRSQD